MNSSIENIKAYLDTIDLSFLQGNFSSLLEFLEWHYLEREPVGERDVLYCMGQLRPFLDHLSRQEDDVVYGLILKLCGEHQARGFRRGFQLGMALAVELCGDSM